MESSSIKEHKEALKYYQIAAENGIAVSMHNCGRLLLKGGYGLDMDKEQADFWFKLAREAGYESS